MGLRSFIRTLRELDEDLDALWDESMINETAIEVLGQKLDDHVDSAPVFSKIIPIKKTTKKKVKA